jgi:putative flippase GtrA
VHVTAALDPMALLLRFKRPARFAVVGVVGATVNSALLFCFITWGRWDPVFSGAIATELAIFCNFTLNDSWTFAGYPYRRSWPQRAFHYNAIAMGGWAVSVATLALLIHLAGMHPMVANIFALVASFAVNYTANKRFTFMRRDGLLDPAAPPPHRATDL